MPLRDAFGDISISAVHESTFEIYAENQSVPFSMCFVFHLNLEYGFMYSGARYIPERALERRVKVTFQSVTFPTTKNGKHGTCRFFDVPISTF